MSDTLTAKRRQVGAWDEFRLSDKFYIRYGRANPGDGGSVPVIGSSGTFAWTSRPLISYPTVVIGRKGTAGKPWLTQGPSHPSDTTFYLEPREGAVVDLIFLFYALSHFQPEASDDVIPSLQRHHLEALELPLPPAGEQRAIAAVLAKIQAAAETQGKIVAKLKELKAATMFKIFRIGSHNEALKDAVFGILPKKWTINTLGTIAKISTGTTPATDKPEYYAGDVPFVKTSEIDNNIITSSQQVVSRQAVAKYNLRIYPKGTVLLAMYGQGKTRGRASLLEIPATTTQNTAAIEPSALINSEFLWHYLLSQYEALRNAGNLGHLSHLNLGYVKAWQIPIPPMEQQIKISQSLSLLHQRITAAEIKQKILSALFDGALQILITGQVRLRIPTTPMTTIDRTNKWAQNGASNG